jgi:hypothetical protein
MRYILNKRGKTIATSTPSHTVVITGMIVLLLLALAGCAHQGSGVSVLSPVSDMPGTPDSSSEVLDGPGWHLVIMGGSYTDGDLEIENWDNARKRMYRLFEAREIPLRSVNIMSAKPDYVGETFEGTEIRPASVRELEEVLASLPIGPGDGLILYLSSHGSRDQGIWIETSAGRGEILSPGALDAMLDDLGREVPMLIMLSACYAGQFINTPNNVIEEDRVVLTAARRDRSSFGCGSGIEMPEWDDSLLDTLEDLPERISWQQVSLEIDRRIAIKESNFDRSRRSYPQSYIPQRVHPMLSELLGMLAEGGGVSYFGLIPSVALALSGFSGQ